MSLVLAFVFGIKGLCFNFTIYNLPFPSYKGIHEMCFYYDCASTVVCSFSSLLKKINTIIILLIIDPCFSNRKSSINKVIVGISLIYETIVFHCIHLCTQRTQYPGFSSTLICVSATLNCELSWH